MRLPNPENWLDLPHRNFERKILDRCVRLFMMDYTTRGRRKILLNGFEKPSRGRVVDYKQRVIEIFMHLKRCLALVIRVINPFGY